MSQDDFNVANQTMPTARAKINSALKALATLSSGPDEPATTFPHMVWFHTTPGILKQRNAADDGWIELWKLGVNKWTADFEALTVGGAGGANIGKNKIDNGTCKVHQLVDPFTLVKDAYGFPIDRWEVMGTGTAVSAGTADQATDGPGLSGKCIKIIQASITGTGIIYWRHRIESLVAEDLKNLIASFQCLVKQSTGAAVNYTATLRKANATDNFSAVTEIANSGQISVPDATDTVLKFENVSMGDCSNGIEIEVKAEVGAITLKDLWITEMQLEEGSVATAFERVRFEDELERCMQCVRKSHPYSVAPTAANSKAVPAGTAVATNKLADCVFWEKPMRTTPTITIYDISGNAGYASHANTNVQVGTGSIVSSQASEKGFPNISESLAFTVGDLYNFNYLAVCNL